jgi:hypothetical protein
VPESTLKQRVGAIKELANPGRQPSIFYLPEYEGANFDMPKCVVDLLEVASFPPSQLDALSSLIQLRLSRDALQSLQERIAYCFGRFGAPDHLYFNEEEWDFETERLARRQG